MMKGSRSVTYIIASATKYGSKHKNWVNGPIVTPADTILRAIDDLCDVLRGEQIVKGTTRNAIDMLVDI